MASNGRGKTKKGDENRFPEIPVIMYINFKNIIKYYSTILTAIKMVENYHQVEPCRPPLEMVVPLMFPSDVSVAHHRHILIFCLQHFYNFNFALGSLYITRIFSTTSENFLIMLPVWFLNVRSSSEVIMPNCFAMAFAVSLWSPVIITGIIPACMCSAF
jgi:hypothetical protein